MAQYFAKQRLFMPDWFWSGRLFFAAVGAKRTAAGIVIE
jgi:hypothetical protein